MIHRKSKVPARAAVALSLVVATSTVAVAQGAAFYEVFGTGCRGNGFGPVTCDSVNPAGGTNNTVSLLNEYAYGFRAKSAMTVIGFEFFTQTFSRTINATMRTALYRQKSATTVEPAADSVARGEMPVSPKAQFYSSFLSTPVAVKKGEAFWVSGYDSTLVRAAGLSAGKSPALPTFWRAKPGNTTSKWAVTGIVNYPSVRILCVGQGAKGVTPILTHNGLPILGKSFSLEVRQAIPGQPATLLIGLSFLRWGALPLPFDLTPIGAPSCELRVAGSVLLSMGVTGANGYAKVTIPVPNQGSVAGIPFFNQIWVLDKANNRLGIAITNAGVGAAGK